MYQHPPPSHYISLTNIPHLLRNCAYSLGDTHSQNENIYGQQFFSSYIGFLLVLDHLTRRFYSFFTMPKATQQGMARNLSDHQLPDSGISCLIILNVRQEKKYFVRVLKATYLNQPIYKIFKRMYLCIICFATVCHVLIQFFSM